ncbi:hypothetical protein OPT61_g6210 [Boeremia exigua]|uniref:Uncharacterized protein n=1 Tax=Boeremia exigua TaxID=749465 RepID=A0ACC2I7J8_9PLEO|nr:hypothetical protein OPT61_g6210 [Boeremia exigua]
MSPILHHESTRVPVTALASCGALLIAAEGPYLRFYHAKSSKYVASKRVFTAQAVHGICVFAEEHNDVTKLVIWGGRLIRALQINALPDHHSGEPLCLSLSNVVKAPDWILDLAPRWGSLNDGDVHIQGICAAVTAHNALLQFTIRRQSGTAQAPDPLILTFSELTTSSRSILYSAHLLWESSDCILVAAGTAFGEIMYWSWNKSTQGHATSCIHRVFLGHEGSIFDVRISTDLQHQGCSGLKRVIASCSDDRTIRLWDISDVNANVTEGEVLDQSAEAQRIRHTGFSIAATETQPDNSNCLSIGWGHTSRVWKVRFLDCSPCEGSLALLSAGEDATSRTWKLVANTGKADTLPYTLQQIGCSAYHNGKNLWSTVAYRQPAGSMRVACGAADSKLTTYPLVGVNQRTPGDNMTFCEYTIQDLLEVTQPSVHVEASQQPKKVSKKTDSIRSYCFILDMTILLVTNSGKILLKSFDSSTVHPPQNLLTRSNLVGQLEDLSGYSTCASLPAYGIAFVAGSKGSIHMYSAADMTLRTIHTVTGKVGSLLATDLSSADGQHLPMLLVTLVGQKQAQLLLVDIIGSVSSPIREVVNVPLSDLLTGSTITSMSAIKTHSQNTIIFLGFRRGSIGIYTVSHNAASPKASLFRVIEKAHGDETVTVIKFHSSPGNPSVGYLYSAGRDGRLAVHWIDLARNILELVHNLVLPIGPNVEDLYFDSNRLLVHGFSSKKWVLYDVTSEEEIMGVETGGAHRSWAFQSSSNPDLQGGTLVWTRASSLHICSQEGPNHDVLRSGGHGREIKAVAVSTSRGYQPSPNRCHQMIATGAEDTDIKIFQYIGDELVCRTTLRKHTTGIQHLQWSDDSQYLFSSAGSEEFYIWRVRTFDVVVDIGVVCEYVYTPESEFSDLRIMSFDVTRRDSAFTIAMVFSDSSVKTYRYDPTLATRWQSLSKGIYFTSCLTQCTFLSDTTLLTAGTDGHAVVWPLSAKASDEALKWQDPVKIHQNASKTMASYANEDDTTLIVSGGDDGALAFLLAPSLRPVSSSAAQNPNASPPVLVNRAHGSAVTACAVVSVRSHTYVLTSGNDEWLRLWEVAINRVKDIDLAEGSSDRLTVKRLSKVKTSVADVSSMVALDVDSNAPRILVCGVGMEVIRNIMVATRRGAKAAPEAAPAASTLSAPPKRGRKKAAVEEVAEAAPAATTAKATKTKRKVRIEPTPEPEPVTEQVVSQKRTRATRAAKVETTEEELAPVAPKRATRGRKASTPIVEELIVEETAEEEEAPMPEHPVKIQVATRARKAPVKKTPAKKTELAIVEESVTEVEEIPRTATRTRKTVTVEEPIAEEAPKPASRVRKAPARKAPAAKAEDALTAENTVAAEPIRPASRARKVATPLDTAPALAPPSRATRTTRNAELPPASPLKAPARKPTKKATPAKPAKIVLEEPAPMAASIIEETAPALESIEEPFTEYPAVPSTPAHTNQPLTNKRAIFELPQYPKTPAHIKAPVSNKTALAEMPDYPNTPAHIQAPVAASPDTDVLMIEMPEEYPQTPAHIQAPIDSKSALNELPGYPKTPAHIKAPLSARQALAELPDYPKTPAHIVAQSRLSMIEEVSMETSATTAPAALPPVGFFTVPRTPAAQCSPIHVAKKEIFTPQSATPAVVIQAPCTPRAQSSPEHVAVKEVFTSPASAVEDAQVQEDGSAAAAVTPVRSNTPEIVQRTPAVRFMAPSTPPAQCSPEHVAPKEAFTPATATPAIELKAPCTPPAQTSPEHIANKENFTPHSAAPVTPVRAASANRKALGELPDYPTTPALAMEAAIQEEIRASAKKQTPSPSHFSTHDASFEESEINDLSISELENENTPAEKPQAQFAPLQLKPLTLAPPTTKTPFFAPPTFTPSVFTPRATGSLFSAPAQKSPTKAATFVPGTNFSASSFASPMKSSLRSPVKSSLRSPEKRRSNDSPKKAVTWGDFEEPSILFDGPLQGLTFFVDVVSDSGKDQSFLFETLLTDLGAKVLKEWNNTDITHVLYKDGKPDTLKKVVASKGSIKAVNVSWALECEASKKRVDEARYLVNMSAALPSSPKAPIVPCTPAKTPSKYALPPSSGERSQPATPTSSEFDRSINLDDKENSELGIYFEPDGKMAPDQDTQQAEDDDGYPYEAVFDDQEEERRGFCRNLDGATEEAEAVLSRTHILITEFGYGKHGRRLDSVLALSFSDVSMSVHP